MSARFTNLQPADIRMFIRKTLNNDAKQMKPKKKEKNRNYCIFWLFCFTVSFSFFVMCVVSFVPLIKVSL